MFSFNWFSYGVSWQHVAICNAYFYYLTITYSRIIGCHIFSQTVTIDPYTDECGSKTSEVWNKLSESCDAMCVYMNKIILFRLNHCKTIFIVPRKG